MQAILAHRLDRADGEVKPARAAEVARWRWPLLGGAVLSVAAHAVALDALQALSQQGKHRASAGAGTASMPSEQAAHRPMRIRSVTLAARPEIEAVVTRVGSQPLEAMETASTAPQGDEAQAIITDHPGEPAALTSTATSPPPMPLDIAQNAARDDELDAPSEAAPLPAGHDVFIPRPELTVAPVPRTPVMLTAPPGDGGAPARRVGVLSLYIDEAGRVHHIEPSEPRLPPPYEQAAKAAFMTALYTPGQLEGRTVKSRIRVEVVFDNTPLDAP